MKPFYAILLTFLPFTAMAQQKPDTLFFEDFTGKKLDRTKWNVEVTGRTVNNEQQAYIDSTLVLSQHKGSLVITPVFHAGYTSAEQRKYDFLSGRINTSQKFQFTYGTVTARIRMPAGAGLWPAFWAKGEGKWPDCGEIDVMENVGDSSWISSALHGPGYSGKTPLTHRYILPKGTDVTTWHNYSVKWSPDSIVFSVDGVVTYTVTRTEVEKYGRWAYDNPKFLIINFALGGGYPKGVNNVSLPYPGLTESTVAKIKTSKVKYLVDWVLVTK